MERTITYYFTLLSPWAYLGFDAFHSLADQHKAVIEYRPVRLGEVFAATGGLPLAQRPPARQAYRFIELQRWRDARGVPLNLKPAYWPTDATWADKVGIELIRRGLSPHAYLRAAHRAIWVEEADVAKAETLTRLLAPYPDASSILTEATSEAVEAIYAANSTAALAAGVFGAPAYVLDGELFWGQDRLDMLDAALASGRAPFLQPE
jgi:2-hydroxychromene-2-carboxylate isomerase